MGTFIPATDFSLSFAATLVTNTDPTLSYVQLTTTVNSQWGGASKPNVHLGPQWAISFDHYAGGGNGADQMVMWIGNSSQSISFDLDEFTNKIEVWQDIADYYDVDNPSISIPPPFNIQSAQWRRITVQFYNGRIRGHIGGLRMFDRVLPNAFTLTTANLFFWSRTGGLNNNHRFRNVVVYSSLPNTDVKFSQLQTTLGGTNPISFSEYTSTISPIASGTVMSRYKARIYVVQGLFVVRYAHTVTTHPTTEAELTAMNRTFTSASTTTQINGFSYNADNYIVHFRGYIYADVAGTYTFGLNCDDAGDMYVNRTQVAYWYGSHGANGSPVGGTQLTITLDVGLHEFFCRYEEISGADGCTAYWKKPGSSTWVIIPTTAFYREPWMVNGGVYSLYSIGGAGVSSDT